MKREKKVLRIPHNPRISPPRSLVQRRSRLFVNGWPIPRKRTVSVRQRGGDTIPEPVQFQQLCEYAVHRPAGGRWVLVWQ